MNATVTGKLDPDWRWPLVALALSIAGIIGLYLDTAIAMVTIWYRSETFTHAFVVPPIVLWLVWRRRHEVALLRPKPALITLIPIAGIALMWLLGDLTAVNSVTQLAFVAMLVLAVPAVLGLQVAYALLFPLFFMFFAVPIGEFLMPLFMLWTADFTVAALRLSGIPVLREGLQFVIPTGSWSVVEACSGIRYLIASVTVGALFAHLNYQSTQRRVIFVFVSFLVPVVANWLRAYMIVMVGHLSGNTLAVGVDHLIYGWVFFGVVIMLMFVIGARWAEPEPTSNLRPNGTAPFAGVPVSKWLAFALATAGVVLMTAWPLGARWWIDANAVPGAVTMTVPASLATGWQLKEQPRHVYRPSFENPSAEINAWYGNGQQDVGLYLGFYRNQNYARKLVSSSNVLVRSGDPSWSRVSPGSRVANVGSQSVTLRTVELRQAGHTGSDQASRLMVWQIYWINGTLTSSDHIAKVYSAIYRLLGRGDDSAVIVVYADKLQTGPSDVALESFLAANYGAIDALLRQSKASP
jgi:exosortase A